MQSIFLKIGIYLRYVVYATVLLIGGAILWTLFWRYALGYPISSNPVEVSEWIVEGKRDPRLCLKIPSNRNPIVMRPQDSEIRRECLYRVGKLMKDPTVCELLLPSDYGVSCIQNIVPPGDAPDDGINCEDDGKSMRCYSDIGIPKPDIIAEYDKCDSYGTTRKEYCYLGRSAHTQDLADCNKITASPDLQDFCAYRVIVATKQSSLCASLKNPIRKSACEVLLRS